MMAFATASLLRGASRWAQGRLDEAISDAEQAVDAERYGWRHFLPAAYGDARRPARRPRRARRPRPTCAARLDISAHAGSAMLAPWHAALGRLALVERREADALEHFEAWRDVVAGVRNPASFAGWRSASARALSVLGRGEEARALAAEELELARRFGAPRAISVALRELAHAERAAAISTSRSRCSTEAVAIAAASEARLEHCRALLELGTVLRRAGRRTDAGRALGEALEIARACGARLLQERAERGARGRRHARAARGAARRRRAEPERAARRRAGDRGAVEPADRRGAVRHAQGGRVAPRQRLPQARRALARRARRARSARQRADGDGCGAQRTPADDPQAATSSTSRRA